MSTKQTRRRTSKRRHDPAVVRAAEETLGHVESLWRDLFRSPFDEAREAGLTGPQVRLMASLVARGPMTLTALSRTLGMTHSTASGIVDRLQARGLVHRNPDAADGRRTTIVVTDKVSAYVHELEAGPASRLVTIYAKASPRQRRVIVSGLRTLRRLLGRPRSSEKE